MTMFLPMALCSSTTANLRTTMSFHVASRIHNPSFGSTHPQIEADDSSLSGKTCMSEILCLLCSMKSSFDDESFGGWASGLSVPTNWKGLQQFATILTTSVFFFRLSFSAYHHTPVSPMIRSWIYEGIGCEAVTESRSVYLACLVARTRSLDFGIHPIIRLACGSCVAHQYQSP